MQILLALAINIANTVQAVFPIKLAIFQTQTPRHLDFALLWADRPHRGFLSVLAEVAQTLGYEVLVV